jgi:DNA-binding transcriptional MerR regulator
MFKAGQVSEMLDIPASTLWSYVKQFGEHLSAGANRKRGKRYTEGDIDTLRRIRELFAQGRNPEEVAELIKQMVISSDNELASDSALALVPSISKALTETLAVSQALRSEVGDFSDQVEEVARSQGATDEELVKLRAWLALPWYRRLFGKPPD